MRVTRKRIQQALGATRYGTTIVIKQHKSVKKIQFLDRISLPFPVYPLLLIYNTQSLLENIKKVIYHSA
jgi:hypothetical protein